MDRILYVLFAVVATASALLAVSRKSAVAAACWLVVMFFGLAGVFVLMEAYLVAAVQILIYAGAIMVLFLFVIMLLDLKSADLRAHKGPHMPLAGVLLSAAFLGAVVYALSDAAAGMGTADRVAATLVLPPPPPPPPDAAAAGAIFAEVQLSTPIALHEEKSADRSASAGRREHRGRFAYGGKDHDLVVALSGRDEPIVTLDGVALQVPAALGASDEPGTARGSIALPTAAGAPAGASIDLAIARGGLEEHPSGGPDGSPGAIGKVLYSEWVLPFEVTSLLLTSAIFGAVVLTKRRLS